MKKNIKTGGIIIVILICVLFLSANSSDNFSGELSLESLTKINVANAERTLDCYGSYNFTGNWVIIKCNGCSEVAHVKEFEQLSTCSN